VLGYWYWHTKGMGQSSISIHLLTIVTVTAVCKLYYYNTDLVLVARVVSPTLAQANDSHTFAGSVSSKLESHISLSQQSIKTRTSVAMNAGNTAVTIVERWVPLCPMPFAAPIPIHCNYNYTL